jgi:hypothetical protein
MGQKRTKKIHILSLRRSDNNISTITNHLCFSPSSWIIPFSKEELKQWLFPLSTIRPNLVLKLLDYYDEFDNRKTLHEFVEDFNSDDGYELHIHLKPKEVKK